MPDLRTLTQPLEAALAVPVETLDSLAGIDASAVPEPAETFRARVTALRMAIATASEAAPVANLLPPAMRKARELRRDAIRIGAGVAAGLLLMGVWSYTAATTAATHRAEASAIERQVALLEPESARLAELRRVREASVSRQAAIAAFAVQGPRLARLLEAIAEAAEGIALTSVDAAADGTAWRVTVAGMATAAEAPAGQLAVQEFLARLAESPFAGVPSQRPSLRVRSGSAGQAGDASVPEGLSGVEFSVVFMVGR